MILIDTNILLYAINRDSDKSEAACRALESLAGGSSTWAMAWSVVYEFMRVATHHRVFPVPLATGDAWNFVSELIGRPNCLMLTETEVHKETAGACFEEIPRVTGNLMHDFRLAVLMREHGIRDILTEDVDFRLFPWVDIVPLDQF